jgi:[pyruvate, water dikinase]-phosphate phosphotransferase / [pyruvate, water dikinase] kinase
MLTILVVSDATGETAERVVRSALTQFEGAETAIVRRGGVRSPEQIVEVMAEAASQPSLVLHTLVSDDLRRCILDEARRRGIDSMDLMGPMLDRLATHLHLTPREMPGLFKQLGEVRLREIEAVEFAFRHDDGQRAEDLPLAEVVLVGASRTMKTPTTLYLAYRGWFAANIPLVPEVPVPEPLKAFPASRVFCLLQTPNRLLQLRHARASYLELPEEGYATLASVQRDLRHTQRLARDFGWHVIDATGKSVEEVAQEIITLLPAPSGEEPPTTASRPKRGGPTGRLRSTQGT